MVIELLAVFEPHPHWLHIWSIAHKSLINHHLFLDVCNACLNHNMPSCCWLGIKYFETDQRWGCLKLSDLKNSHNNIKNTWILRGWKNACKGAFALRKHLLEFQFLIKYFKLLKFYKQSLKWHPPLKVLATPLLAFVLLKWNFWTTLSLYVFLLDLSINF